MRIYPVEESQKLSGFEIYVEMVQAMQDLGGSITRNNEEEIGSNLLQVMQECVNIAEKYNIDLHREGILHQAKMLNHKYNFKKKGHDIIE